VVCVTHQAQIITSDGSSSPTITKSPILKTAKQLAVGTGKKEE